MLLLGWPEPELKAGGKAGERGGGGLLLVGGSEEEGDGGAGAPVDGTDIFGQVVPLQ